MGLLDRLFRRRSDRPDGQRFLDALQEFINARTWADSRRILEQHPGLLSEDTDALLERLAQAQENAQARRWLKERCALVRHCREVGIDAAFGEISPSAGEPGGPSGLGPSIPPRFRADLRRAQEAKERYVRSGDSRALDEAVAAWERILHHPDFDRSELDFRLAVLSDAGIVYIRRYEARGRIQDLNRPLELCQQAVEQTPAGSPDLPSRLNNLGDGLMERYARTGERADLEKAIRAYEQAVEQTPPGSPERAAILNNLGAGLRARSGRTGELADLEGAIRACEQAVEQTPPGSPDLPGLLSNLGGALRERYARTGELADLEKAIHNFEQAVEQTPAGSPDLPRRLNNLGGALMERYARTGERADLEKAIHNFEQAVEQSPAGSPDFPGFLNNLGAGLRDRYLRTGELADLEKAIRNFEQAVEQTPASSPNLPTFLNNLGGGLRERSGLTGELIDLEKAIRAYEQAVEQSPAGSPDRPTRLNNLGGALRERYGRTGELADLEKAIHYHEQAVEQTPAGSPDFPSFLNNLGAALSDRYERTGELADLERAIYALERALEQTPPDSPRRPSVLVNLGTGLSERCARTGELTDLARGIEALQEAVKQTLPESPDLPAYLNKLAVALRIRYARVGDLADLNAAIASLERAWLLLSTAFVAAPVVYKLGQQREWTGRYVHFVEAHLERAKASPPEASAARRRAMEVTEGGKSRLLTELLGRGEIAAPPIIPRSDVERERKLLEALTSLDTGELSSHGLAAMGEKTTRRADLEQRERCLRELNGLWQAMAQYGPEAEDYVVLRRGDPPDWKVLSGLAADLGPETALLSLFRTTDRTLLFVVREGWEEPAVVDTDLDGRAWADLARRFFREVHGYDSTDRRGDTWDRLLRPLLQRAAAHLAGVERIILAPEAWGHLLPWSVVASGAGLRGPDGLPLPLVTLPALGVLPRLRRRPVGRGSGALVAGNPRGDLRYAEQEAREVAEMFGATPLIGQQATKEAVEEHLPDASVVHLATHAGFVPGSPLDSGIVLADGVLTAREVMSHRLQADLLVLSACRTGMAMTLGGDELAGLAQAFLQAGARSLLVSLWSVNDPATAALMTAFYSARKVGADKAVALSRAMAEVRAREGWSHPYYWGAFVLMGDWV